MFSKSLDCDLEFCQDDETEMDSQSKRMITLENGNDEDFTNIRLKKREGGTFQYTRQAVSSNIFFSFKDFLSKYKNYVFVTSAIFFTIIVIILLIIVVFFITKTDSVAIIPPPSIYYKPGTPQFLIKNSLSQSFTPSITPLSSDILKTITKSKNHDNITSSNTLSGYSTITKTYLLHDDHDSQQTISKDDDDYIKSSSITQDEDTTTITPSTTESSYTIIYSDNNITDFTRTTTIINTKTDDDITDSTKKTINTESNSISQTTTPEYKVPLVPLRSPKF